MPAAKEVISSGSVVAQTIAAAEPVSVPTALPQLPGNLSLSLSLPIPGSSNAALRKVAQEEKKKLLWGSKDDKQVSEIKQREVSVLGVGILDFSFVARALGAAR